MTFLSLDWSKTRVTSELDFETPGTRVGDLRLKHSDNRYALGHIPIPIGLVVGDAPGPSILLTGGVHGDEFEGPLALLKLLKGLRPSALRGRLIVFPALNAPALHASARVSPIDGGNLNRAFPGDPDGGPTAMIAHFIEAVAMPACTAAIDLHAGGKAAWFAPCTMAMPDSEGRPSRENLALAQAFGAPFIWQMGALNDDRSVNAAAQRQGLPMIAAEVGGGGCVSPAMLALVERGLRNALIHLGALNEAADTPPPAPRLLTASDRSHYVHAPRSGLFEPKFEAGENLEAGQPLCAIHSLEEPSRAALEIAAPNDGVAIMRCHRGRVAQGELLAIVLSEVDPDVGAGG